MRPSDPGPSRIATEVRRIRGLLDAKRFAEAITACRSLRKEVPQNRDVLYMLAVSQRYSNLPNEALTTLAELESLHPGYSRLFQERGHCCVALRDLTGALEAFTRAVSLNAALPASWRALHLLLRTVGQVEEAQKAEAQLRHLESLPIPLVTASSMLADGETAEAERVVRTFLLTHPEHIEALTLKAEIEVAVEALDAAEQSFDRVLQLDPRRQRARHQLVLLLLRRQRHATALEQARRLLQGDPDDRRYKTLYAAACVCLGQHAEGLSVYRSLIAADPQAAELHVAIADVLKTEGKHELAIESYRSATTARPGYGYAYWSLANLKTYRFTDDEVAAMQRAEAAADTSNVDRYHLCFALGKGLEDRGAYQQSFRYYERGNALKRTESPYRRDAIDRNAEQQVAVCTRDFFDARSGFGCGRSDPIFIVGLPRTGSTLIEQILASHSLVEGTMELPVVPLLVHSLQGFPAVLRDLSAEDFRLLGEKYLAEAGIYRTGKPFFIDKMPNNFRFLGLIHLMLPNAKIIDARRDPMACCFSNFKQLFAVGQEFSYSLDDLGHYHGRYIELMDHWNEVLPGRILRVQHENLVQDLEGHVRRMLEFCELDFEEACLRFHQTERSVRTASSEQVRRPLNDDGLHQWRHFEPWLGPLRAVLESAQSVAPPQH